MKITNIDAFQRGPKYGKKSKKTIKVSRLKKKKATYRKKV